MTHNECIEDVLIDWQLLLAHKLQNPCGALDVALLAIARDQSLERHTIRLDTFGLQIGQKFRRREWMLILQINTQQSIVVRHIHGNAQIVQGFPDLLHESGSRLGQFLGHQITCAKNT